MTVRAQETVGHWCQPKNLRRGWELWTGAEWAKVTAVRLGEVVHITVTDGQVFRCGYADAIRCRPGD